MKNKAYYPGLAASLFILSVLLVWSAPHASAQPQQPNRIEVDVPFEDRAPWWNRDHTEVEDEVLLRGTLHVSGRVWAANPTHIDRVAVHINLVDVHGTSETTGQRYRLHGTYDLDVRDPQIAVDQFGKFNLPLNDIHFRLRKVDPEPALLNNEYGSSSLAMYVPNSPGAPPPIPCRRVNQPNGSPSAFVNCGNVQFGWVFLPVPYEDRVLVSSGQACASSPCEVPDGATLFNGFAGDYNPPLYMRARIWAPPSDLYIHDAQLRWHCKTGDLEAPVISVGGGEYVRCSPLFSSIAPISVYAEISYNAYWYASGTFAVQTFVVSEPPHIYHMLARPGNNPPVIDAASFSVKASSGPSQGFGARCLPNVRCTVLNGDVLFNGTRGDFVPPLYMRLNATDPDGDPLSIRWFCRTGNTDFAPVVDLGNGNFTCDPVRSFNDSTVSVYAVVSDGGFETISEVRTLVMPGS